MPVPNTPKALQRSVGLFSYYAHWIKCFSDKIAPLLGNQSFPLTRKAVDAFQNLRSEIAEYLSSHLLTNLHLLNLKLMLVISRFQRF